MNLSRSFATWIARLAVVAALAVAAVWTFRVAVADSFGRSGTVKGTERAIAWTPDQSLNYVRLSVLTAETNPERAKAALEKAVALNPSDARSWIDLALRSEVEGDIKRAKRCLLRAAEVDNQYLPRWSLANFYYRENDSERFWIWAKRSSEMLYGDPAPLFRLCDDVADGGNLIERLDLRTPDLQASYLNYIMARGRNKLLASVAGRVLPHRRPTDVPILLTACDRLIQLGAVEDALAIWNSLADSRQIPYRLLSPSADPTVTNDEFSIAPSARGFDWFLPDVAGVSASREDESGGIRLTFTGRQPESCLVLSQLIPVTENTRYEAEYRYNTSGIADLAGLSWSVEFPDSKDTAPTSADIPAQAHEDRRAFPFDTPPGCRLVRLGVTYRRALGSTRIEGWLMIRQVRLRKVDHDGRQFVQH